MSVHFLHFKRILHKNIILRNQHNYKYNGHAKKKYVIYVEDYYILRCGAVQSGGNFPTFRKNILPPFSESRSKPNKQNLLASCCDFIFDTEDGGSTFPRFNTLYVVTSQETVVFIGTAVSASNQTLLRWACRLPSDNVTYLPLPNSSNKVRLRELLGRNGEGQEWELPGEGELRSSVGGESLCPLLH
jgi:hypothetical protein